MSEHLELPLSQPAAAAHDGSSEIVKVTLPAELVSRLRQIADSRGVGVSTVVRMMLLASFDRPA